VGQDGILTTPSAPRVTIVMPAHNEQDLLATAVHAVVEGLRARAMSFEVLVVENGSVDGTAEAAKTVAHELPEVQVLSLAEADYGRALRAGFLAARGELVANFDVDYVDVDFLDRAIPQAEGTDGAVVVVGSKRTAGAHDTRGPGRRLVTAVFAGVLRHGFGLHVSDTHGMKVLRRDELGPIVERCRFGTDLFDTELVLRAERAGLRTTEVAVKVEELRPSRSPITSRIPRTVAGLARLRWALWREPGLRAGRR
jgi:glycosyltransferase involved in cell wall biosynthesis